MLLRVQSQNEDERPINNHNTRCSDGNTKERATKTAWVYQGKLHQGGITEQNLEG